MNMRSGASAAAIILAASLTWAGAAQAQENSNSASTTLAQTSQMPGMTGQQQGTQPGQPGMMGPGMGQGQGMGPGQGQGQGMMGQGMGPGMGQGMMGRGTGQSMAGRDGRGHGRGWRKRRGMRQHLMKVMFAVADQDGNGALSFNEVTEIHRRIFNAIDANKDGQVTMDELRNFMPGP